MIEHEHEAFREVHAKQSKTESSGLAAYENIWNIILKIFVTRKGSFGLGPTQMRGGDEIYLLPGARCPLVLRKHTVLGLNRISHTFITIATWTRLWMVIML
jgi:hypothetical protein